jgi:hypothetical protein
MSKLLIYQKKALNNQHSAHELNRKGSKTGFPFAFFAAVAVKVMD